MLELNGIENNDDGDSSGQELVMDAEATTVCATTVALKELTEFVVPKFIARLVTEYKGKKMIERKGKERCYESGSTSYVTEEEQDCLVHKQTKQNVVEEQSINRYHETRGKEGCSIHKQKKRKIGLVTESTEKKKTERKGTKRCYESGSSSYVAEGENDCLIHKQKKQTVIEKQIINNYHETGGEEGFLTHKQKKQKIGDNEKKRQKTNKINKEKKPRDKGQDPNIEKFISMGLEPPPDMPQVFKDCIQNLGGTEIKLVIQKFLQITDLKSSQNRFSMTLKQVRNTELLNEDEERKMNKKEAIEVVFIEPCCKVSKLNLNKWEIGASWSYVLNGAWYKNVVRNNDNSLKPKAAVQVWSFRAGPNSKLGFAMIKVAHGEDGHVID